MDYIIIAVIVSAFDENNVNTSYTWVSKEELLLEICLLMLRVCFPFLSCPGIQDEYIYN